MTADPGGYRYVYIGVSKPDLNLEAQNGATMNTWYLRGTNGALYGNGKVREDEQGKIQVGDRIGVLLDLRPGKGTLAFYLNGTAYGSGFTSGVQGPVVRAVEMYEGAVLLPPNRNQLQRQLQHQDRPQDQPLSHYHQQARGALALQWVWQALTQACARVCVRTCLQVALFLSSLIMLNVICLFI
jgi:hypothetical protein